MNFKGLIYIFWKKICFHFRRHPYFAIWTVAWVATGLYDSFLKDFSSVAYGIFIGLIPWLIYRGIRILDGHGLQDKINRKREFEKYIFKK